MLRLTLTLAAIGLGATLAQADPIAERKDIMDGVGSATRAGVQMVRGEREFDLDTARSVLATYIDAAQRMPDLFPEGTETGGDTRAAPAIWMNKADFVGKFEAWEMQVAAVLDSVVDQPSFAAAMQPAAASCRDCHTNYRLPD